MSKLEPTRTCSNPTATEILRRLLDERGVEWQAYELNPFEKTTSWDIDTSDPAHEVCASLEEFDSGTTLLRFWNCTPAQAIAATLGSSNCTNSERTETCHDEGDPSDFCCSACGVRMFTDTNDTYTMIASDGRTIIKRPNYCPNCGAKVVEPTTNDVDVKEDA